VVASLADGVAVSTSHALDSPDRTVEAGAFAPEGVRGRGYAVDVVALWACALRKKLRAMLMRGTIWDSAASRSVARKFEIMIYGEEFHNSNPLNQRR
jgi:hypothetical protein